MRKIYNLDFDWKFHLGEVERSLTNEVGAIAGAVKAGGATGAASITFDDSEWRQLNLPHDYLAESDFSEENLSSHGYRYRNNAWYRKTFALDEDIKNKHVLLCFEGTAVNADFYFNASPVAKSCSAYVETAIDVTDRVFTGGGALNNIAVHINGMTTEGWWYEGAGIYRHVKLYIKELLHIAHNGVFIKPVKNADGDWTVYVETEVENSGYDNPAAVVEVSLFDGEKKIASSVSQEFNACERGKVTVKQSFNVSDPKLWDVDSPNLYNVEVKLLSNGKELDSVTERTGFRTFYVDAEKGFFLNGRSLKIKGTCNHQDHAGVGVAVPDSVQNYRIKRLKEMGTNAYRCSHNPPAKEILDACDEQGLIVMDENRRFESGDEFIRLLVTMVKRDRNHPSIIFWSLFNEEPLQNTETGARIFKHLKSVVHNLDDSRLIMGAINGTMDGAGMEMDVTGINYRISSIAKMHEQHPLQPIIGSENNSAVTTRGCYKSDAEKCVLACYDDGAVKWGESVRQTWSFARKSPYYAGIFIWTGFDYRGEPTPYNWPSVSSQFGIMDTCGFAKDSFYYNRACFCEEPVIHVMPHWNHTEGEEIRVAAPTNCTEAELFLNGKSLGRKTSDCIDTPEWMVKYVPGEIKVVGYVDGKEVCSDACKTAGAAVKINVETTTLKLKDDENDTAIINVSLVDENGTILPCADDMIKFSTSGDIYLRGVGNGDPNSHESDVLPQRKLFAGRCQALVSAKYGGKGGSITVSADGLASETIEFEIENVKQNLVLSSQSVVVMYRLYMTEITPTRPDPLMVVSGNDMNTFMAVDTTDHHQNDFHSGWRLYRLPVSLPKCKKIGISIPNSWYDKMEIYVDGKEIFSSEREEKTSKIDKNFSVDVDENATEAEIRILIYIENFAYAGIRDGISIVFI